MLSSEDFQSSAHRKGDEGVDLRTLRAIRVLRPLKLVSGVPSEYKEGSQSCAQCPVHVHRARV